MLRLDSLSLPLDFTPETLNALILRKLKCAPEQLKSVVPLKKAVDARDKADVHFVLSVAVTLKDEAKVLARLKPGVAAPFTFPKAPTLPKARFEHPPVVVGAGPAGLFAALTLARAGVQPILIERGKPVEERTKSVQMMQEQGILDPESNVQFGEGGAGAFSDGKLTTGTKSPLIRTVLQPSSITARRRTSCTSQNRTSVQICSRALCARCGRKSSSWAVKCGLTRA